MFEGGIPLQAKHIIDVRKLEAELREMEAFAHSIALPVSRHQVGVTTCPLVRQTPQMGPWKKGEKDEAFRQQQEILKRRRDAKRNAQYFEDVEKRREEVETYFDNRTLKVRENEDPLVAWKEMKEKGFVDEAGYEEDDEGGIPIPMASFGIPKYDRGGRFDLRLPHVEHGYTDPDADVMSKAGNAFKKLFGFGKDNDGAPEK